ncbi:serine/threonine-protein phosphatase [Leptospira wolffii]|uniref:PP2C family protein-serine/threonine phosphatase n=1 Tax=Leptospira wolffii TaxID=409998 RepID=UPI0003498C70|nr:PP2C family protein-serine/threonine phosphatase [Leptospira wolffii]TGK59956.1 serine/threonine-protein phosphatase [Leptospira wolffii]TGK67588.1 serine/threonine-protein phosphatase [Leptospira wolffii]TGK75964.1 serine/threonine-protein phosphatase [Leptospira wolffii]TGL30215.1 serine/threonine-protein phosphatase [Leptospira wolffii]
MSFDPSITKRILNKSGRLLSFLEEDPERKKFAEEYKEDLRRQIRALQYPGCILGIFVWLGFAFGTDQKLHPEFPELFYFRIGLTIVSLLCLGVLLLDTLFRIPTRHYSLEYAYVFVSYLVLSTSFFTGRIADDPNYVSGLQIVLITLVFIPLLKKTYFIILGLSLLFFIGSVLLYSPNIGTSQASYSLQNLGIAYLIALVFSVILERYRFLNFVSRFRILERNKEISEQMLQIQALKEKQDGDYFLTSLLLSPLIKSEESPDSSVKLEFLLDQYKKFSFKNKDYELGGDFLSAYRIRLRETEYTAFINGDAMGKSIQGAGGALVLGSVFNSIVSRTRLSPEIQSRSPERWLKETFVDLQNVFETFDGFMLVSAVLGLLDHKTGTLYFINAEHPWPVLYRDGKAMFLGADSHILKIGISELFGSKIQVQTFRMLPGDTVFCGSDGRDDLILEQDFSGKRVINEDETQFLHSVEESKGDLKTIQKSLARKGKLSDDLSLLSISYLPEKNLYMEDRKSIVESENLVRNGKMSEAIRILEASLSRSKGSGMHSPFTARFLSKLYDKDSQYEKAAIWSETSLGWDPSDTEALFQASLLWKKSFVQKKTDSSLQAAIEWGERLRVRNPSHTKNLVNLTDLYRISGNSIRARKLLEEAYQLSPEDGKVAELRKKLDLLP